MAESNAALEQNGDHHDGQAHHQDLIKKGQHPRGRRHSEFFNPVAQVGGQNPFIVEKTTGCIDHGDHNADEQGFDRLQAIKARKKDHLQDADSKSNKDNSQVGPGNFQGQSEAT